MLPILKISKELVNVKATTEEGLGFTGTQEGISSQAICMISSFFEASVAVGGNCETCGGCKKN